MYEVVYLSTAKQQLVDAAIYIAPDLSAPDAAEQLLDAVNEQISKLCVHPYQYPIYPLLYDMHHEIRYFPVKNYLVFYVVREEQKIVEIWRFLHQRQNAGKHLQSIS